MVQRNLIAVDLAKKVSHVCGLSNQQKVVFNKSLRRTELAAFMANQPPMEVAMEACYSSHYWARCFTAMGHRVKLLPAQHVTPFVRGNKSDHNDALAIAEARVVRISNRCPSSRLNNRIFRHCIAYESAM